ncbi:MAG: hypothetical protein DMG69_15290 [Acidobacteria bacterium]|nr:MAG: hypothetical protein DMG69_15290 [Acidobacteriota bacterium]
MEGALSSKSISRRDVLKSLTMGAVAGSVLRVIPAEAAEYAHHMIQAEKASSPDAPYKPKFFSDHQYKTLQALCQGSADQRECGIQAEVGGRDDVAGLYVH